MNRRNFIISITAIFGAMILGYLFFRPGPLSMLIFMIWQVLNRPINDRVFVLTFYILLSVGFFIVCFYFFRKLLIKDTRESKFYFVVLVTGLSVVFLWMFYNDYKIPICEWTQIILGKESTVVTVPPKQYSQDSTHIVSYISEKLNATEVYVDTIIYSNDTTKFFSLTVCRKQDLSRDKTSSYRNFCVLGVKKNKWDWELKPGYDGILVKDQNIDTVRFKVRQHVFDTFSFNDSWCRKSYWTDIYTFKVSFPEIVK